MSTNKERHGPEALAIRPDDPPKNVNAHGLTAEQQQDWEHIYKDGKIQKINFINLSYPGYDGNAKTVVGAIYSATCKLLPVQLPLLLPPLKGPAAYEIRDIAGKGKGVIATRNIALGELIIIERPVLIYPSIMTDIQAHRSFPMYAKQWMAPGDWEEYNSLVNMKDNKISRFDGIKATNGFEIKLVGAKESYGGVFLESSRLNHSCGPNLRTIWSADLLTFSAQAVRPIPAGQELTISYEDMCSSHANRRFELQRKYKFDCTCGYCTKTSSTSDFDRARAYPNYVIRNCAEMYDALLQPGLPSIVGRRNTRYFLNMLIKDLVSITKEGIESGSALWFYVYLMKVSGLLGDKAKLKQWGFKAILSSVKYVETKGEEAYRDLEQWIDWVKEPEKRFPAWGRFR